MPESVVIGGTRYVPESKAEPSKPSTTKIVILQRGWVMVGHLFRMEDECVLTRASVIRIWGTTKGLGEIALNGPTPKTVLDPCGTVRFHILTTIATLDVMEERWLGKLV